MNPSRILVPLLILAGLAAAGYWFYSQSASDISPAPTDPQRNEDPTGPNKPVAPPPEVAKATPPIENPVEEPTRVEAVADNTNDDAPQGVKGRIMLPTGQPAANVPIFLIESMMNDPIKAFLMSKSGRTPPPVSFGQTAEDGTFALGVREANKGYDLRVASDINPELNYQVTKVREDDWFDTGDLKLSNGLRLTGRVLDEVTNVGIAGATIYLTNSNQAHTMLPTPGRERGIVAITDNSGAFFFDNAPAKGSVNLLAEAPGYASARLDNQRVEEKTDFTVEISKGRPIAGIVVDTEGKPLPNVPITAQGLSQKTPQTEKTTSDAQGVFQFPSLREGPYTLRASSNAHAETTSPPVMTGDLEAKLVLVQRPWVKLRVTGADGKPVKNYRISLKRYFPNNPLGIGNVPEFNDRSINPSDYPAEFGRDWAIVRGVPTGEFVFQIKDRVHAKSLSQPFTVRDAMEPVEVTAQMTLGAAIVGVVVDDRGQPVRGAYVNTDMNNAFQGDGGIFELFRSMIPERHSKKQVRTNKSGQFRFDKLAFAEYMVRVGHPDFCEGRQLDIKLTEEGQVVDVGTIQLNRGTIIEGFTSITGQAAGQVKITLSIPPEQQNAAVREGQEGGTPVSMGQMFSASVVSENDGRYRLPKRVPPGTYKIVAARSSGEQQNPFMILLDMRETERIVTLRPGQDRMKINFDLPSR
ncbi:MAG: carboxypeptidase regulatory-like domain-containing protein [bacterium]|nr:carboxypeptidase regulatory-like domain-containing protein [bacterium]